MTACRGVQQPEEDRRRIGVTVTRAAERAGRALAEHILVVAGRGQAVGKPVVVLLGQPGGDHQVEHDDAQDVDDGDDPRRGGGDPGRGTEPHDAARRQPTPRTVSIRAPPPASSDRAVAVG